MPVGTESGASPASRASGHFPGTPLDLEFYEYYEYYEYCPGGGCRRVAEHRP